MALTKHSRIEVTGSSDIESMFRALSRKGSGQLLLPTSLPPNRIGFAAELIQFIITWKRRFPTAVPAITLSLKHDPTPQVQSFVSSAHGLVAAWLSEDLATKEGQLLGARKAAAMAEHNARLWLSLEHLEKRQPERSIFFPCLDNIDLDQPASPNVYYGKPPAAAKNNLN